MMLVRICIGWVIISVAIAIVAVVAVIVVTCIVLAISRFQDVADAEG